MYSGLKVAKMFAMGMPRTCVAYGLKAYDLALPISPQGLNMKPTGLVHEAWRLQNA